MRPLPLILILFSSCYCRKPSEGRFLSLFNTVIFENAPCIGTGGDAGVCLSFSECNSGGGRKVGNCASGFGTCCQFVYTECGATLRHNCSIWENPGYPSTSNAAGTCDFKIEKAREDICFIRLDFEHLDTAKYDGNGNCHLDKVSFTQGNGFPIPSMCGTLTGQHMYLDAGSEFEHTEMRVTHKFTGTDYNRRYRYKVSQICCGEDWTPDRGCLQYLYGGVAGTVESYNFDGGYHLNGQHYAICIRQEKGYCMIEYTPTDAPNSFHFSRTDSKALIGDDCKPDYVSIPRARNKSHPPGVSLCTTNTGTVHDTDRFCGGSLNCIRNEVTDQTIVSESGPPFNIHVFSNHDERYDPPNDNVGFQLHYVQTPC